MLRGLKDTFETRGFEVLTAADGETGCAAALNASADLILLDIMLPRVNGKRQSNPSVPRRNPVMK